MRADRLISILMLLQAHGRVTAARLAEELEVSVRTIYRDIDALGAAGIPIYGDRGPEGGYALLDTYRDTLTGLTTDELRALLMLNIPSPLDDLGLTPKLKAAMRKLSAALPGRHPTEQTPPQPHIHLDASWWGQDQEDTPFLSTIHEAVRTNHKLRIHWHIHYGLPQDIEQIVAPYGLVAKASVWYVVCALEERILAHRVSYLTEVELLETTFSRPVDFDLAAFWQQWCIGYDTSRPTYSVKARIAPHLIPDLPHYFGAQMEARIAAATPDAAGWITVELPFDLLGTARSRLLALGRAVEVLDPEPLRLSIIDYAKQILDLYQANQNNEESEGNEHS